MIMYTRNSNNRESANIHNEDMLKKQIAMNNIKNTPRNVDVSTKKNGKSTSTGDNHFIALQ